MNSTVKSFVPEKPMPNSLEAEMSLLSSIILYPDGLVEIIDIVHEDDFYSPSNQLIYKTIIKLFNDSIPIDVVSITEMMIETGDIHNLKYQGYDKSSYIAFLVEQCPVATNGPHYAEIVRDRAIQRRLIAGGHEIIKSAWAGGPVTDMVDDAEKVVFSISDARSQKSVHSIADLIGMTMDGIEHRQRHRGVSGIASGLSDFDHLTGGFQPSDLIIIAARPSMGKTALALNIARNAAVKGHGVAFFSLEMSDEQLTQRLIASEGRVSLWRLRNGFIDMDMWDAMNTASGTLHDVPLYIDDTASISIIDVKARLRRLMQRKPLGLVVIDYLQLMRGHNNERRELEISDISRSLKAIAKEFGLPVIALSQLNRKVEERANKRPILSDLRESGSIEQDADVVAFIYRDEVYNSDTHHKGTAEIILGKQRNGPTGITTVAYQSEYTQFVDLDKFHKEARNEAR